MFVPMFLAESPVLGAVVGVLNLVDRSTADCAFLEFALSFCTTLAASNPQLTEATFN